MPWTAGYSNISSNSVDLADMRQNGVRSIEVMCYGCRHESQRRSVSRGGLHECRHETRTGAGQSGCIHSVSQDQTGLASGF
jgi:hypothetical protein